jgi:hypothetical protein
MLDHHNSDVEKTIFDRKSKGTIFPELLWKFEQKILQTGRDINESRFSFFFSKKKRDKEEGYGLSLRGGGIIVISVVIVHKQIPWFKTNLHDLNPPLKQIPWFKTNPPRLKSPTQIPWFKTNPPRLKSPTKTNPLV